MARWCRWSTPPRVPSSRRSRYTYRHDAGCAAARVDVDLGDRQEGERLVRGALHLQLGGELDEAARRLRRQQAVAALVLGQVVDDQGVGFQPRGVLAARPAEPVAGLGAQVAAPGVGAQAAVHVAPGHQHAAVAELLGVGPVERERQHLRGRPGMAAVGGEGDQARQPGGVVLAHHAGQAAVAQQHQRPLAEQVVAVAGHVAALLPGGAAVRGGEQEAAVRLVVAQVLGDHAQGAVRQLHYPVRLVAGDAGHLRAAPGVALVVAPVGQDAGGLALVEVAEVVQVDQDHQAAVAQPAQARGDHALVAAAQVGARHPAVLAPGAAAVVAYQQGEDLILLRPVLIIVAVDQHQPPARQLDQVGVLGEAAGAAPDIVGTVVQGARMVQHGSIKRRPLPRVNRTRGTGITSRASRAPAATSRPAAPTAG